MKYFMILICILIISPVLAVAIDGYLVFRELRVKTKPIEVRQEDLS